MNTINHILLAADGSEGSRDAAALAKDLAAACGAKISVITVNDEDALSLPAMIEAALPDTTPYSAFPKSDMRKIIEQHAEQEILAPIISTLGETPSSVTTIQRWGQPAREICAYAEENGVDLVVIGRRGSSQFKQLFLGSVSTQVVTHASCPVLVSK